MSELTAAQEQRALAASRIAVSIMFFAGGSALTVWATYIPLLKARAGLDDAQMGLVLLCVSMGCLFGMPTAGVLRPRLGPVRAGAIGGMVFTASIFAPALGWTMPTLAAAAFAIGVSFGFFDVCLNSNATAVEREFGRPILSSIHGFFSMGNVAGALGAGALIGLGLDIVHGLAIASLVLIAIAALASPWLWLPEAHVREATSGSVFQLPNRTMIGIGAMTVLAFVVELGLLDWGALFLVQATSATPATAAYGLAAFSLAMTVGRMTGDRVVHRFGDVATVRLSAAMATVGVGLVAVAPSTLLALPGFAIAGLGISNLVPVLFSVSGRVPGVLPAAGIAMTVTMAYGGGLFGPPLIGFVAHAQGMRVAFVVLAIAVLIIAVVVGAVIPHAARRQRRAAGN